MLSRSLNFMLLDDDPDYHEILEDYIRMIPEQENAEFHAETDQESLIIAAKAARPDIIFVDYNLGARTGVEAIRALSIAQIDCPIIMLTGFDSEEALEHACSAGAVDYMTKDEIDPPQLVRIIRYAMDTQMRRRALRSAVEQMNLARATQHEFLSNLSHELRTPLNAIVGFSALLMIDPDGLDSRQVSAMATDINNAGKQLVSLIEQLFMVRDKGAALRDDLRLGLFNLEELVVPTVNRYHRVADGRDISFDLKLEEVPDKVTTDPDVFLLILRALTDNAVKFTETQGNVSLVLRGQGDDLLLEVKDTGIGMDRQTLNQATEAFFQREGGYTRRYGGTGLGLTLARNAVELLGGQMDIQSKPGVGTTVRVCIPAAVAEAGLTQAVVC